jgi:Caspase domain
MIGLISMALAGVVAVEPDSAAFTPRRIAVLVGIGDYQDPRLQDLRFAGKDARDLAAALSSPDLGDFDRVFVVDQEAMTTRDALRRTLDIAAGDLGREDTFLLYFSGHGTLTLTPEGSRLWFLPSDGLLEEPERTGIAVEELEAWVADLPARRRVLIMDTCHNGRSGSKSSLSSSTESLLRGFRGEAPAPRSVQEVSESEARLYAAEYHQPAMEDPRLENGVYTHYLIEAMGSGADDADLNGDRLVDIAEAHQYARDHTIAFTGGIQVPRAEYRIVGREEIFLSGKPADRSAAEQALLSACDLLLNRAILLVNGSSRGAFPGLYAIEPGYQKIEVQSAEGRTLYRDRIHFVAGTTVPIEALIQGRAPSVAVLGTGSWSGGSSWIPSLQGGVQVVWARPFHSAAAFRPDLHGGFTAGQGQVFDSTASVYGGYGFVGFTAAYSGQGLWVGPSLDLRIPWRTDGSGERQAGLGGSGGLSAGFTVPLGRQLSLEARLDGWAGAAPYGGELQPSWGAGLGAGLSRSRVR